MCIRSLIIKNAYFRVNTYCITILQGNLSEKIVKGDLRFPLRYIFSIEKLRMATAAVTIRSKECVHAYCRLCGEGDDDYSSISLPVRKIIYTLGQWILRYSENWLQSSDMIISYPWYIFMV